MEVGEARAGGVHQVCAIMGKLIWSVWGRYMALASAYALIDGGVASLLFSWPSFYTIKGWVPLFRPISVPGVIGMFMGLVTLSFEFKRPIFSVSMAARPPLYLLISGFCGLQFTNIIAAQFYMITALVYLGAVIAGEAHDREAVAARQIARKVVLA